ncbi:hypothetical protein HNQ94_000948 [Salirhabdus euzebyi]|uniref:Lipoprotein n=1 Tax=Salirhabdus euzebyi TaxID=394506 RepID=A0A841Q1Y9_9BACI|nr:hypothetical protein [Salirhabdus euzebyi]MBB6452503.1 hypothetical protein [Salirhabdus euzebyi]
MRNVFLLFFLSLLLILTSCSRTEIPDEFQDLRPSNSSEFYIIGFQQHQHEVERINSELEKFVEDDSVIGVTMYYKVSEKPDSILEKFNINDGSGFIVLINEGIPYYISSYSEFKN